MRCYICDQELKEKEVNTETKTGKFQPCTACMNSIHNTIDEWVTLDNDQANPEKFGDFGWDVVSPQPDDKDV